MQDHLTRMDNTGPTGSHAAKAADVARLRSEQARQRREDAVIREAELEAGLVGVQKAAERAAIAARAADAAQVRAVTAHERSAEAHVNAARLHERAAKLAESRGELDLVDRHQRAAAKERKAANAALRTARENLQTLDAEDSGLTLSP
jgi:hypothetical protein